jgi:hypothetical protein
VRARIQKEKNGTKKKKRFKFREKRIEIEGKWKKK